MWQTFAGVGEHILDPFKTFQIPLGGAVDWFINWAVMNFRPVFQAIRWPVDYTLTGMEALLQAIPPLFILIFVWLFGWQVAGRRITILALISLIIIGLIGAWESAMTTVSLVLTAVCFCILIGIPLGIFAARSERFEAVIRPVLDAMQTTPAFVYLVPIVMLFGIGNVPGVVVTIIFALPPLIRLTNLGLRQVPADVVEAAMAFGATPRQLLFKVQMPLALRTIMAGLNQTLMMSLSMVVIASMIAVGGLGQMVLRGIGRLDMGLATVGGLGIVLLAIGIDRLTQALSRPPREKTTRHWYERGPAALLLKALGKLPQAS
jgi:glycine betaine/proline transport system permease protein